MLKLNLDCRHFRGEKPCFAGRLCEGCTDYAPMGKRVLVIKLDAIGDVVRTTPILRPLRAKYAPCHVTWLTAPSALDLVRDHELVEVALPYDAASLARLRVEEFDVVLSLDKTPRAASVAMAVKAPLKLGFGLSPWGTAYPLNQEAEYAFQLGLDDDLKFRQNRRTYQDIIFEVCRLPYSREEYEIPLPEQERERAQEALGNMGIAPDDAVIGLNLGGGAMFANKMWAAPQCVDFLRRLRERVPCKVLLFGAERERAKMDAILADGLSDVFSTGLANPLRRFQALLGQCRVLVGGDTLGMHLAIAERVPQVVLFGPTCAREIELYGRGETLESPHDCKPCYRKSCGKAPTCMEAIDPDSVVAAVERLLDLRTSG